MKILLSLVICSQVAGTCLEPYPWPETFENQYDCMVFGYEESLRKIKQIGPEEVNTHNIYITRFAHQVNSNHYVDGPG